MIEVLYTITGFVTIVAGCSQAYQLVKVGRSDELSVSTWTMWLVGQVVTFLYAMTLKEWAFLLISGSWVLLHIVIVGLIFYYRYYPRPVLVQEEAGVRNGG